MRTRTFSFIHSLARSQSSSYSSLLNLRMGKRHTMDIPPVHAIHARDKKKRQPTATCNKQREAGLEILLFLP